jgi:hypothetical protein
MHDTEPFRIDMAIRHVVQKFDTVIQKVMVLADKQYFMYKKRQGGRRTSLNKNNL